MDISLFKKYNKPGPRYTSYPPATFFSTDFTADNYKKQIEKSNSDIPENISLYVHIPFCKNLCHFCGCNTNIFRSDSLVDSYIEALKKEIKNVAALLDKKRLVSQIHWGGGTPNSISLDYIEQIMKLLGDEFTYAPYIEIAMECNPAYLSLQDIERLAEIGFNRLSLGIQDFDDDVLEIVNRAPSKLPVETLVEKMKATGFEGVNLDFIYGLPGQSKESFEKNIERAIEISPDRIVTFSYAHVPWVKEAQKILESKGLPSPEEKLQMFSAAYNKLTAKGYVSVGMDHYAKPQDELSIALKNKTLHRNFQGYATKKTTGQVYGFGATSISQLWGAYAQNIKNPQKYIQKINSDGFATERGYELTFDDLVRRTVINEIMCNGFLDFNQIADMFNISADEVKQKTAYAPENLAPFVDDNLLVIENDTIKLKPKGFFIVRNIAMEFDPQLTSKKAQYSKTV